MSDPAEFERQAALRGFRGHAALTDPEGHVAQVVAQNDTNEFGIPDKMTLGSTRAPRPASDYNETEAEQNARNAKINAALNDRLLQKYSQAQIDAYMAGGELPGE